jgi:hypothetical protein
MRRDELTAIFHGPRLTMKTMATRLPVCECAPARPAAPVIVPSAPPIPPPQPALRRRRIWDLAGSLHCSIIGTCLGTDALRRVLRKAGVGPADASDHTLHKLAVGLAGRQGEVGAKLLNKLLDEQHRAAIRRFDAAGDEAAARSLWRSAMEAGEIPGAYWAVLTHPATGQGLLQEAFGDVHMLSHLVGAANRADIRRLSDQANEIAALRETVARQQARLRHDLTERDARIRALQDMLAASPEPVSPTRDHAEAATLEILADMTDRARREAARREAAEARRDQAEAAGARQAGQLAALEAENATLRAELAAAEAAFAPEADDAAAPRHMTVLYVGGRSGQTQPLREAARRAGALLLHHDAEAGSALLPGLVGRADLVVFPVDCVSHDAALGVKRLCRQLAKPFCPLRSTGAASLLAALRATAQMAAE